MALPFQYIQEIECEFVSPEIAFSMVKPLDLFFCCGTDPVAKIIEGVTHSPISHCGFAFPDGATIESTFLGGVHIGNLCDYLGGSDGPCIIGRLAGMDDVNRDALGLLAYEQIGKKYEVTEEIQQLMDKLGMLKHVAARWTKLYCSALVQDVLRRTPWEIPDDPTGANATPADVWRQTFVDPVVATWERR